MGFIHDYELLAQQLEKYEQEHKDLNALLDNSDPDKLDNFTTRRFKKRKLWLKDQMTKIQDLLYPDIIA